MPEPVVPEPIEAVHAPVAVAIADSVPMLVLEPAKEPEASGRVAAAPRAERTREPAAPSMLAVVLQSSISTAKDRKSVV